MQVPLQIVFRDMSPSAALSAKIQDRVEWLERFSGQLISCRVAVEIPHRHHRRGNLFRVRLDLRVPGRELVVSRSPDLHGAHRDLHVLIHDAFDEARRVLEQYARKRRRDVKTLVTSDQAHGLITELVSYSHEGEGYGFLRDEQGRELYFHARSVLGQQFSDLKVGDEVRFSEELGEKGPQARSVDRVGRQGRRFSFSSKEI